MSATTRRRGVLAVVRDRDGAVLMQLRDDRPDIVWPAHWSVLGGGTEPGESAREAVVREVHEESGLVVRDAREIGQVVDEHGSGQLLHVFVVDFRGDPGQLVLGEGQRLEFVARHRWPDLLIPPYVRELLRALPEQGDT
ncbi:NUDIX domain-containing protein [Micromonospora sp. NPDC050187]|uniref:NUDIX domain-containing protein n=1 Tax=Micromonospora sp. NPDC050187 TaxID=3364277 RepID=UPI0037AF5623